MFKSIATCTALALAFLSPAMAEDTLQSADATATAAAAGEVPQAVKDACKDDYEKHCKKHEPESAAARECMAGAFEKLSDPCVTAILDSPLVEQAQQQLANAPANDGNSAEGTDTSATKPAAATRTMQRNGHNVRGTASAHKIRDPDIEPATHTAKARHAAPAKYASVKSKRRIAHHASGPRKSVAGYVRRGTGIANYYVAKYTRFAFAKGFR